MPACAGMTAFVPRLRFRSRLQDFVKNFDTVRVAGAGGFRRPPKINLNN